jgi:hypothetical protein
MYCVSVVRAAAHRAERDIRIPKLKQKAPFAHQKAATFCTGLSYRATPTQGAIRVSRAQFKGELPEAILSG